MFITGKKKKGENKQRQAKGEKQKTSIIPPKGHYLQSGAPTLTPVVFFTFS